MKIRFIHRGKDGNSVTFDVQKLPATLGRDADNGIALCDKSVSKQHAQISLKKNKLFIEDLDSTHGIYVNGNKVTSSALSTFDLVRLGSYELEVNLEELEADSISDEWDLSTQMISS